MRCRKAQRQMILFAGDDLDEKKIPALLSHLNQCTACTVELEKIRRSRAAVNRIGREDAPDPLPSDFSDQIFAWVREEKAGQTEPAAIRKGFMSWRPAAAAAGVIMALLILFSLQQVVRKQPEVSTPGHIAETGGIAPVELSKVTWNRKSGKIAGFEGPFRLDTWDPPIEAGVFAIMHRIDGESKSGAYTIDYCGETGNFSSCRRYPWIQQREKRFIARAGSQENLYIAVDFMPGSTKQNRQSMEKVLIDKFNPYFNKKGV